MLHDPKWNHGTLAGLITWLEGQPRDETYVYNNPCDCLIARYMGEAHNASWSSAMRDIYGGNDQHKIARGYLPEAVYSAHWIADPALREPVARYLDQERRAVEEDMGYLTAEFSPFRHED